MAGSVIAGIAVMLSMSMMPANADPVENICLVLELDISTLCTTAPFEGQRAMVISEKARGPTVPSAGCHYVIVDATSHWVFVFEHGPAKCPSLPIAVLQMSVTVVGS